MANLGVVLTVQMCIDCLASIADNIPDTVADATAGVALVLAGAAEAGPHVVGFVPADCDCGCGCGEMMDSSGDRDGRQ